jgi:hypothetical protein
MSVFVLIVVAFTNLGGASSSQDFETAAECSAAEALSRRASTNASGSTTAIILPCIEISDEVSNP